jgi:putative ABC transport system permease protein
MVHTLWQDVISAVRSWRRSLAVAILAVSMMGGLIGGVTVLATLIGAIVFDIGPHPYPERVVDVRIRVDGSPSRIAYDDYLALEEALGGRTTFEAFAAQVALVLNVTGAGDPFWLRAMRVTARAFAILEVPAIVGRPLTEADATPGAPPVVVLNEEIWRSRFGARVDVVGLVVNIDEQPHTIVGVMPRSFKLYGDAWTPMRPDLYYSDPGQRRDLGVTMMARLAEGRSATAAAEQLTAFFRAGMPDRPGGYPEHVSASLERPQSGDGAFLPGLLALLAGVVALLTIAGCLNIAMLLLARANARVRELAVRMSLGASGWALARRQFVEAGLIAAAAALIGIWLAWSTLPIVIQAIPEGHLPWGVTLELNWPVLLAVAGVCFLVALVAGVAPAVLVSRSNLDPLLKEGGRGAGGGGVRAWTWQAFVAAEVAIAMTLLVLTVVAARSVFALRAEPLGFTPDRVLSLTVALGTRHPADRRVEFMRQVLDRYRAVAGVEAASVGAVPLQSGARRGFVVDGRAEQDGDTASVNVVGAHYLRTLSIPLLRGREMTEADEGARRPVAVINQAFARAYFDGADPIGRSLRLRERGTSNVAAETYEIIGVSGNVGGPDRRVGPEMYVPFTAAGSGATGSTLTFVVRTSAGDPMRTVDVLKRELWAVDPGQAFGYIRTANETLRVMTRLGRAQFQTTVVATFGVTALILTAMGVYGILSFRVSQETRTLGVRAALGATEVRLKAHVLSLGLRPVALGILLGSGAAAAAARLAQATLVGVSNAGPAAYGIAVLILLCISASACYVPARRAASIDPIATLRLD